MLFSLHPVIAGLVFIAGVIAVSLASYALTRWALLARTDEDSRELAGSVLFRVAALHGLVLALVFAQELTSIRDVHVTSAHEAAMLADIYYDLERYDAEGTQEIRAELARYAIAVIDEEWPSLAGDGRLSDAAWQAWERGYESILDLSPETPRQERLLGIMLADIRELSELREARENAAHFGASQLFLIAALSGILLISAGYFTYPATALNLMLLSGFAAFTGLIIFFVMAYANPYHAPGNATPLGFERFLSDEVRALGAR
ncbi:DUF4239 domain-containing protein [Roseovarius faecimaris]|uniref:DUF4239 domain-containing protein n=1 Tax=Roseovarius faecimaris TaxID=2494550 RepID=A0A6I6ILU2_9RHOB|nr:DUF4239 domain-containing protein [Roseovarius faecimaris]QGX98040.1 DUF4239 domain-containing protein [Roseovarius faecimaris]